MDAADQLPDFGIRPGGDGAGVQNRHVAGGNVLDLLEARFEQLLLDRSTVRLARAATEIEKLECGHGKRISAAGVRMAFLCNVVELPRLDTPHPEFARLEVFEVELSRGWRRSAAAENTPDSRPVAPESA